MFAVGRELPRALRTYPYQRNSGTSFHQAQDISDKSSYPGYPHSKLSSVVLICINIGRRSEAIFRFIFSNHQGDDVHEFRYCFWTEGPLGLQSR